MASVIVKVQGAQPKEEQAETLGELKRKLGMGTFQATINGDPENDDSYQLEDYQVVTLTEKVKGA